MFFGDCTPCLELILVIQGGLSDVGGLLMLLILHCLVFQKFLHRHAGFK